MDLELNNLQRLIYHKTQQTTNHLLISFGAWMQWTERNRVEDTASKLTKKRQRDVC